MTALPITATIKINGGTTAGLDSFSLVSAPYFIRLAPDVALSGQDPTVTEHDSDDGPPDAINLEEENRVWAFNLRVTGATKADVLASINTLKRHIQGKQSTAYQAFRNGSQPDVTFEMKLDSSTPTTTFIVQYGSIKDNSSFYTVAAQTNDQALNVDITLTCTPAGRGAIISLRNDLASSPHMLEDSDSDGLADGWVTTGAPAVQIDTTRWVVGGQSQQFITAAVGEQGIGQNITASIDTDIVASVWVQGTGDIASIQLLDGGFSIIQVVTFDPSSPTTNADMTIISDDGTTWYRHSVSGINSGAANVKLRVFRTSGSATQVTTIRVDAAYLELDQTVIPSAFCSASALENRFDPTAANNDRINYLDVALVPGDMPWEYEMDVKGPLLSGGAKRYISVNNDGVRMAADADIFSQGFTPSTGWTNTVDVTVAGGRYWSTNIPNAIPLLKQYNEPLSYDTFSNPVRIFGVCYATDASTAFQLTYRVGAGDTTTLPEITIPAINTFNLIDLGLVNIVGTLPRDDAQALEVKFDIFANGTAGTARVNGLFVMQGHDKGFMITSESEGTIRYYSDKNEAYKIASSDNFKLTPSGSLQNTLPEKMGRFVFVLGGTTSDFIYDPTDTIDITLSVTPIASHLIGE